MEKSKIQLIQSQSIALSLLDTNDGQIAGVPANPRTIDPVDFANLKKSIEDNPEMLGMRELLVYPVGGRYVVIGGNMRLKAMRELGFADAPCKVLPESTDTATLRAVLIKDNVQKGEWDAAMLQNDWSADELQEWGVELPEFKEPKADDEDGDDSDGNGYKIAYELVFNDEAEQTEFYDLLRELKNRLQGYDTISERMIAALRFWRNNYEE